MLRGVSHGGRPGVPQSRITRSPRTGISRLQALPTATLTLTARTFRPALPRLTLKPLAQTARPPPRSSSAPNIHQPADGDRSLHRPTLMPPKISYYICIVFWVVVQIVLWSVTLMSARPPPRSLSAPNIHQPADRDRSLHRPTLKGHPYD